MRCAGPEELLALGAGGTAAVVGRACAARGARGPAWAATTTRENPASSRASSRS